MGWSDQPVFIGSINQDLRGLLAEQRETESVWWEKAAEVRESSRQGQYWPPLPLGETVMVLWRNDHGVTHRIVANDGSFDTGDVAQALSS